MKALFDAADRYLKKSDWRDIAILKFCLFSLGMVCALQLPAKAKKPALCAAACVFVASYLPLMAKFVGILLKPEEE